MLPLVISCGPRALPTAARASHYYADAGIAALIVRPRASASEDVRFPQGTRFVDDEALAGVAEVRAFLDENREALAQFSRSPGWFLQQFIKLAVVASLDTEFVFVSDGDTVFSRDLLSAILRDPIVLTTGEKFENYNRLLLALGIAPAKMSCVANGNIFARSPLLRDLAAPAGFEAVLRDHVLASRGKLDFSEYQIAGSILEPQLGSRRIRMFRRLDLLIGDVALVPERLIVRALRRYDAVAIEVNHHRSIPKRVAAALLYAMGRSW